MNEEYFNCLNCGVPIERRSNRQKYCPRCRAERDIASKREAARRSNEKRAELRRAMVSLNAPMINCAGCGVLTANAGRYRYTPNKKPQAEEKHYTRPRRTGLLFDLSGKDLAEVALEAKALGMSYGEYTSACFGGTIERKLAMQGISREEAGKMIANAKRKRTLAKKKKAS